MSRSTMIRPIILLLLVLSLSACTGSGTKTPFKSDQTSSSVSFDSSEPTTFDEYKEWRKANDTNGQLYADYIKWEAEYKQWRKAQNNLIQ